MLRNHLHTYSSNKVNSIQYQISFFKKSFKYIRLWLPKCHFIHKAANTIYSSYIIFFSSHKIHLIKFYLYIVYYWSMELRVIAEGFCHHLSLSCTRSSPTRVIHTPAISHCNLKAEDIMVAILRLHLHCLKTRISPPAAGGDHCIGVALGTGILSRVSSTTASTVEIQQNILGCNCAMADVAQRAQWYLNCVKELRSPLPVWPTWKQNKGEKQPGRTVLLHSHGQNKMKQKEEMCSVVRGKTFLLQACSGFCL